MRKTIIIIIIQKMKYNDIPNLGWGYVAYEAIQECNNLKIFDSCSTDISFLEYLKVTEKFIRLQPKTLFYG